MAAKVMSLIPTVSSIKITLEEPEQGQGLTTFFYMCIVDNIHTEEHLAYGLRLFIICKYAYFPEIFTTHTGVPGQKPRSSSVSGLI